ncbi:MAG: hypothetical protein JSV96_01935 [Candidatus Aminicenantes bacterium]|nr:MAG: hypothetical protein JSV96_01935 [Candidatus Aminicenantes bacterium]
MKKEDSDKFEIDDLLKQTLKDDLPPELESRMKKQLILFRKKMEQSEQKHREETNGALQRLFHGGGLKWMRWMLKKQVLAPASIIMVVLGAVLQITGPSSVLAESISLLKTSVIASNRVSHAESMECSIKLLSENKEHFKYLIQWLSPNLTRVQVKKQNQDIIKTMWISEEEITIADHATNTLRKVKNVDQIDDPELQHALGLLSPHGLLEQMEGKWQLKQYKQQGDCESGIFTVAFPEEKTLMELTVDLCTFLPTSFKKFIEDPKEKSREGKILMNVNFRWNTSIPTQLMLPKITKGSRCA